MKHSPSSRLYPDNVYAVRPETYDPFAIDAVADYIRRQFGMETLPDAGFVRHILSDPETGLKRFVSTNRERLEPKQVSAVQSHIDSIRRVIEAALLQSKEYAEARKPKYEGVAPTQSISFLGQQDTALLDWAYTALCKIATEVEGEFIDDVVIDIEESITSALGERHEELLTEFGQVIRAGIEKGVTRGSLALAIQKLINHRYLIPQGQYVSTVAGEEITSEALVPSEIEEIDLYDTANGKIPVLSVIESESARTELKTPCFDAINQVVIMPIGYMLSEARTMFIHNCTSQLSKKLSKAAGDYRYGKNEQRYYRALWGNGSTEDLLKIQDVLGSETMHPSDQWRKIREIPALKKLWSGILAEELRHGMDDATMRLASESMSREEIEAVNIPTELLTKPEGALRQELIAKAVELSEVQRRMLDAAVMEYCGKMTQISGGISPKSGIAHIVYTLESSRILKEGRYHTLRGELAEAERPQSERASWEHAMACRMIAIQLGRYFKLVESEFGFDRTFDDVELMNALQKIERMPEDDIRKAVKSVTDDDFVIPVDAPPFPEILPDGKLKLEA